MAQASQYGERAAERVENVAEKATDQFRNMAERAGSAAGQVAEQSREAGERAQDMAGNLKGTVEKSVRDQPIATLALVAIAGFVLGALWKR